MVLDVQMPKSQRETAIQNNPDISVMMDFFSILCNFGLHQVLTRKLFF